MIISSIIMITDKGHRKRRLPHPAGAAASPHPSRRSRNCAKTPNSVICVSEYKVAFFLLHQQHRSVLPFSTQLDETTPSIGPTRVHDALCSTVTRPFDPPSPCGPPSFPAKPTECDGRRKAAQGGSRGSPGGAGRIDCATTEQSCEKR